MDNKFKVALLDIYRFATNRIVLLCVVFFVAFYAIVLKLFDLQIINGSVYIKKQKSTSTKTISVNAPRGTIFDRFGRPLALNELTYIVRIDTSVKPKNVTEVYIRLIELMKQNGESLYDEFPIDVDPLRFNISSSAKQIWWKKNMDADENFSAAESFLFLRDKFSLPAEMSNADARDILSLLSAVYLERYNLDPITIAFNVKQETIIALEESNSDFPGIFVDVDYLRTYPESELFSHILGYIRKADEKDLELYKDYGYKADDIVGKTGIEKAYELQLNGTDGKVIAEIDSAGRRVGTLSEEPPVPGDKVFLTVDRDLQEKCYSILNNLLKDVLVAKLKGGSSTERAFTDRELVISMFNANNISLDEIMLSGEENYSYKIKQYITENLAITEEITEDEYKKKQLEFACDAIDKRKISVSSVILAMCEQGIITLTENEISKLANGKENTQSLLIRKLQEGEITPQMTNLPPSTGSIVVVDVDSGDVLAAVGYPSYDNNQLVNSFNNSYFTKLNSDPTTPMVNRPFSEPRPPGSVFKMVTGLAGLENGVITTKSTIFDKGEFQDAGKPYPKCRRSVGAGGFHGSVNVMDALKVSCNYFFYDVAYRLGNTKSGNKLEGIAKFNEMMAMFGLDKRSGVEIGELADTYPEDILITSSPSLKKYNAEQRGFGETEWVDGDTVTTGIGQALSNYTAASMAKYIATIATKGSRYQLHLMSKVQDAKGEIVAEFAPNLESQLDVKPENMAAIIEGMRRVTQESGGTAATVFSSFPVKIAGKTGTAQQEAEFDHTTFGGFAPFDDPQIAIFVLIPYGDTKTMSAPASLAAKQVFTEYFGLNHMPELTANNNQLVK